MAARNQSNCKQAQRRRRPCFARLMPPASQPASQPASKPASQQASKPARSLACLQLAEARAREERAPRTGLYLWRARRGFARLARSLKLASSFPRSLNSSSLFSLSLFLSNRTKTRIVCGCFSRGFVVSSLPQAQACSPASQSRWKQSVVWPRSFRSNQAATATTKLACQLDKPAQLANLLEPILC